MALLATIFCAAMQFITSFVGGWHVGSFVHRRGGWAGYLALLAVWFCAIFIWKDR